MRTAFVHEGRCGCGRVEVTLATHRTPSELQPRTDAPTCSMCRRHDGTWISDPGGWLEAAPGLTRVERFATEQVAFHFCPGCGALAYATFEHAGVHVAVVRLALFETLRTLVPPARVVSFEAESIEVARDRRLRSWTPVRP